MEKQKRKVYRNYARSERSIIRAYVSLMHEKGNGKITVTDIVTRADLNRSTFYAHFKTSDDVRKKIHDDVISELMDVLEIGDYTNSLSVPVLPLQNTINFLKKDEEMYKMLLRTEGASKFLKSIENVVIDKYLTDEVVLPKIKNRDEFEDILRLFIGGFISVLQDWAEDSLNSSLERVAELVEQAIKKLSEQYISAQPS